MFRIKIRKIQYDSNFMIDITMDIPIYLYDQFYFTYLIVTVLFYTRKNIIIIKYFQYFYEKQKFENS